MGRKLRENTLTVVLNCNQACRNGFCDSMRAGPFLQLEDGFDVVLTAKTNDYLVEFASSKGKKLIEKIDGLQKATKKDFIEKKEIETKAKNSFTKHLDTTDLPELFTAFNA